PPIIAPASYISLHLSSYSIFFFHSHRAPLDLHSFPTRRSSDLCLHFLADCGGQVRRIALRADHQIGPTGLICRHVHRGVRLRSRSEEHTSELQSRENLVCRLLLEKKKKNNHRYHNSTHIIDESA